MNEREYRNEMKNQIIGVNEERDGDKVSVVSKQDG